MDFGEALVTQLFEASKTEEGRTRLSTTLKREFEAILDNNFLEALFIGHFDSASPTDLLVKYFRTLRNACIDSESNASMICGLATIDFLSQRLKLLSLGLGPNLERDDRKIELNHFEISKALSQFISNYATNGGIFTESLWYGSSSSAQKIEPFGQNIRNLLAYTSFAKNKAATAAILSCIYNSLMKLDSSGDISSTANESGKSRRFLTDFCSCRELLCQILMSICDTDVNAPAAKTADIKGGRSNSNSSINDKPDLFEWARFIMLHIIRNDKLKYVFECISPTSKSESTWTFEQTVLLQLLLDIFEDDSSVAVLADLSNNGSDAFKREIFPELIIFMTLRITDSKQIIERLFPRRDSTGGSTGEPLQEKTTISDSSSSSSSGREDAEIDVKFKQLDIMMADSLHTSAICCLVECLSSMVSSYISIHQLQIDRNFSLSNNSSSISANAGDVAISSGQFLDIRGHMVNSGILPSLRRILEPFQAGLHDEEETRNARWQLTQMALRLMSNIVFRNRAAQESARVDGCLLFVVSKCYTDFKNPLVRESAVLAVRNCCEGCPENQAMIESFKLEGNVQLYDSLEAKGLKVKDSSNKDAMVGDNNNSSSSSSSSSSISSSKSSNISSSSSSSGDSSTNII